MAVMASPQPETADASLKAADAAPVKADKAEANGHKSPSPITNGKDASAPDVAKEPTAEENAAATEKSNDAPSEPPASAPSATKPDSTDGADGPNGADVTPAARDEKSSPPKDTTDDVDMGEAEATGDTSKSVEEPREEKASAAETTESTDAPKSSEPEKDVDMKQPTDETSRKPDEDAAQKSDEGVEQKPDEGAKQKPEEDTAHKPEEDTAQKPADADPETTVEGSSEQPADAPKPNGSAANKPSSPETAAQDADVKEASLSQLNIDAKDESSGDVEMSDVQATAPDSIKVAREREDDAIEEPAAKRARTEPSESEGPSSAPAPAPTSGPSTGNPTDSADPAQAPVPELDDLPGWDDPEVQSRPITPYRTREYRRTLAGMKKTKAGSHFKDAVAKLWPVLAESYLAIVEKPMDIGLMERNLRDGTVYPTLGDLKKDLALLLANSQKYNGPANPVTFSARSAVEQTWARFLEIPAEEPPKTKAPPKHNPTRHTEPRQAAQPTPPAPPAPRKESRAVPTSPTNKGDSEAYSVPPGGVPQVRRASTQNEHDRPKRTIHPPKNRDIDYTAMQNFNKKKLPLELQFGFDVVNELMDPKHEYVNGPFLAPVDPVALQIPNYWSIIKKPMDLSTMKSKFVQGEYHTLQQVQQDVKLIISNCNKFNGPDHPVTAQSKELENLAKTQWSKKEQWMAKNTPAKPAETASGESEEESEDDEEAPQPSSAKVSNSTAVLQLEQRLADETNKLSQMFINIDGSDETMIDVQRTVVNAIRKRLIEEKEKAGTQKAEKPAKGKPSKASGKSKAGGGAGGKRAGGAAASRKSGGGGGGSKKASKRVMTQVEKDAIANGINDLDENNITKAIDIIKKDTGQTENASGELELEIDQLTNDALHKLWDLLKRVLPGFGSSIPAAAPANDGPSNSKGSKAGGNNGAKPKKNKPMNAKEQEARIAELERLKQSYQGGQDPTGEKEPEEPLHPFREESSDSEEE